ncbi:LPXTG cell wall anchor domain-containing protein [Arcanobacterium hippocoleae]|uniref:LPXTG cell wall anchor domain-containing protein n=1 Tax=Arcanobacterium hippocoleae TaxID=149017 RepID=UPI0033402FDF
METKAPTGYALIHEPIKFNVKLGNKVTKTTTWETDANGDIISGTEKNVVVWEPGAVDPKTGIVELELTKPDTNFETATDLSGKVTVINIKDTPNLPLTGGAGIAIFGVLGAAIVAGGIYGAKRNSRKEQEA